uniref:Cytochrome c oxidase subunit 7A2, mitochondrial n=1 Tax=Paramormyrops kingsleyae TaxID=1676925 RepID=A0A3B3QFJ3_9TELE|nr:cytochrome c oxidase subunit 7A2, mitochondrial-like [Paramormyrops kingsleyae]
MQRRGTDRCGVNPEPSGKLCRFRRRAAVRWLFASKMFRHLWTFRRVSGRPLCTSAGRQTGNKVPLNQRALQDSAMPVHLKGGSGDTLLYRLTMGLTVLGSGYVIYELVKATLPKKTE